MATAIVETLDMKLGVVVLGVADVDRAKSFYQKVGCRIDADHATGDDFRVVQVTPHSSAASSSAKESRRPGQARRTA